MGFLAAADPSCVSGCNSRLYAFGQREVKCLFRRGMCRCLDREQFAGAHKGGYFL